MSMNTNYGYETPSGVPGGIYDLSPHTVNSRITGSAGVSLGIGVVQGTSKGTEIVVPTSGSTEATFEGVTLNSFSHEMEKDGKVIIQKGATLEVMNQGKVWVKVSKNAKDVGYGVSANLVLSGDEVGFFTTAADTTTESKLALTKVKFITAVSDGIAVVEIGK